VGQYLKGRSPGIEVIGVEPVGSSIFGGEYEASFLIAGAGMRGPCELTVAHGSVIDRYAKVPDTEAAAFAIYGRAELGFPVGLSAGAALRVAVQVAEGEGRSVAVIAPDTSVGFRDEIEALAARVPSARTLPRVAVEPTAGICWAELFRKENAA
jgi:cysteine synthase